MPEAAAEEKATGLGGRAAEFGKRGDSDRAIAGFTAVIEMPDAPAEQKAMALVSRGAESDNAAIQKERLPTSRR